GRRVRGAGADLHVIGLQQRAALLVPVFLESEDDLLEGEHRILVVRGPGERRPQAPGPDVSKPGILTGVAARLWHGAARRRATGPRGGANMGDGVSSASGRIIRPCARSSAADNAAFVPA